MLANRLLVMERPEFPVVFGVIYCNPAATYEEMFYEQVRDETPSIESLLRRGQTWVVGA